MNSAGRTRYADGASSELKVDSTNRYAAFVNRIVSARMSMVSRASRPKRV